MPPMQPFQQLNYAKQTVQSLQPVPNRRRFTDIKDKSELIAKEQNLILSINFLFSY